MLSKNILIIDKLILSLPDDFNGGLNSALEKLIQYRSTEDAMMENKGGNFVFTAFDFPDDLNPDDTSQLTKESLMQYLVDNEDKVLAGVMSVAEFDEELGGYRNKYTKNEMKEFLRKQELLNRYDKLYNANVENDECKEIYDSEDFNKNNDDSDMTFDKYANMFPFNMCFYTVYPKNGGVLYYGGNLISALEACGKEDWDNKFISASICDYPILPTKYHNGTSGFYYHIEQLSTILDKYIKLINNINKLIIDKNCTFRLIVDHMENTYNDANALLWDMVLNYYIYRTDPDNEEAYSDKDYRSSFSLDVINNCDKEMFEIIDNINSDIVDFGSIVYDTLANIMVYWKFSNDDYDDIDERINPKDYDCTNEPSEE